MEEFEWLRGKQFRKPAKNGKMVTYEIFDYMIFPNTVTLFFQNIKGKKNVCSTISLKGLLDRVEANDILWDA